MITALAVFYAFIATATAAALMDDTLNPKAGPPIATTRTEWAAVLIIVAAAALIWPITMVGVIVDHFSRRHQ
jgi:hypothetical protein